MIEGLLGGLSGLFTLHNMLLLVLGCGLGTFIGMMPGLGPVTAISLLIPVVLTLEPASAMVLLAAIYYGAMFGGSTASVLINAPGESSSVPTTFDGYPMAKKGQAGKALALCAWGSFVGGTIATMLLMLAAPTLASWALTFQAPEYFALMVLGLTAVAAFAEEGGALKALLMTVLGLMIATIGTDIADGVERYTFHIADLADGISFVLLAMAAFALSEAILAALRNQPVSEEAKKAARGDVGSLKLTKDDVREVAPAVARSSLIGFVVGVLPGAGATIAAFMSYAVERNLARGARREEFGKGSRRGVAAPETANNAAAGGAYVPLLTLGIPGSGTTAVILGALVALGVQPGPRLFVDQSDMFWTVVVSMYVGNLILLAINLPLIPQIARTLAIPERMLVPLILFFCLIGVYLVSFNAFDLWVMIGLAVVCVGLRLLDYPMAPLLLGFVLGKLMEENLRRALIVNDGSFAFLWERPVTAGLLAVSIACLAAPVLARVFKRKG
ncbi:MAG: tripartite tricarboxylate transporter permease [Azospirillum sp.]|nr:tripartite tricarboxylate transporter permease [Azospirillum sp.]MCA3266862.1 tripartite tricarboxylate transporter permease [Azospirillum sp.]MCZ8124990.1 tripartite tricarboxylate transporter permease [Magnetospirillum sp.]